MLAQHMLHAEDTNVNVEPMPPDLTIMSAHVDECSDCGFIQARCRKIERNQVANIQQMIE